ncbi:hypothetical protein DOE78_18820 [Bacillus sp. Y1]|nr:hypothetical protein [Bacillus sp. Y1]AYA77336.1 hypothetical protein DOE78_18820 [Bacillus sp. Y1]
MAAGVKLTIEEVREIFKQEECYLLSETYSRNTDRLEYIATCGHTCTIKFTNFRKGNGRECRKCCLARRAKEKYNQISSVFQQEGCFLLSKEYVNNKEKLKYRCSCGNISMISFDNFNRGRRCNNCKSARVRDAQITPFEIVKKEFESRGCVLLDTKYIGAHQKLNYICKCGNYSKIALNNLKQGQFCKGCGIKKRAASQRLDYAYIQQYFNDCGCELLTKVYEGNRTRLTYRCKCGNIAETTFHTFKKAKNCRECGFKKASIRLQKSISEVQKIYEEQGCELLEKDYKGQSEVMRYKCRCGNEGMKSLQAFRLCSKCPTCIANTVRETTKLTFSEVKEIFTKEGCELISEEYLGVSEPLEYLCKCGKPHTKSLSAFKMCSECPDCYREKRLGPNNWRWNFNLSDQEREENKSRASAPEQRVWKKKVFRRDNFKCRCCGSKKSNTLRAHHLDGYNWCVERRTDIYNGVTLCDTCHKDFHAAYGYGDNTEHQFNEWLQSNKNADAE